MLRRLLPLLVLTGALAVPSTAVAAPPSLPAGVPAAALRAEPVLPAPPAWPFGEDFPRTSGTGRLGGGAFFWSDFVYDDAGATDPLAFPANLFGGTSTLAPTQGVYRYAAGAAAGNGADVFRTAVGADDAATYWRVDWTTLVDPAVPLAVWGIDLDGVAATGGSAWPAGAGVSSPGQERYLVVSAAGARMLDAAGAVVATLPTAVDLPSRSFLVRVPRTALAVGGTSTLRLVAGLADAGGTALATPSRTTTGLPAAGAVYNAAFRSIADEPPVFEGGSDLGAQVAAVVTAMGTTPPLDRAGYDGQARIVTGNFWMEDHQATALAAGDVTDFAEPVDWGALAARQATPEPRPSGYSNRWYVSGLDLGQGVVEDASSPGDLEPNYLSRIQPYAVQVPEGLADGAPLTWVLHSLSVNHNQYGALDPATLAELCDDRGSICATTLGHGPDLWYFDEGEADFWQVWRELAETYRPSTEQTVISGYSMGGYAAYKLGLSHPDLFAAALSLAGPPSCGVQVAEGVLAPADQAPGSRCAAEGSTAPLVPNALHLPYVIAHGAADQLVPFPSVLQRVQQLQDLGYRHRFTLYPAEDHLVYATQDRFSSEVQGLGGTPSRTVDPARVRYAWYPRLADERLGIGPTTAYWLSGLQAASAEPGTVARVEARSLPLPDPAVTAVPVGPSAVTVPTPGTLTGLAWELGAAPATSAALELDLTGVSGLTVDGRRARVGCGTTIATTSDVPARLTVTGLPAGAQLDGALPAGESTRTVVCASGGATAVPRAAADGRLPATGAAPAAALLGVVLLAGAGAVRRRRG